MYEREQSHASAESTTTHEADTARSPDRRSSTLAAPTNPVDSALVGTQQGPGTASSGSVDQPTVEGAPKAQREGEGHIGGQAYGMPLTASALEPVALMNAGGQPPDPLQNSATKFLRPPPARFDSSIETDVHNIAAGQKVFKAYDWKAAVDWAGFSAFLVKAPSVQNTIENTINPRIGSAQAVVQSTHDRYQEHLSAVFERERLRIEQIVKTDPAVTDRVTSINETKGELQAAVGHKASALDRVEAATSEMAAAVAAGEQEKAKDDKTKAEANLANVQEQKKKAIAEMEAIPGMLLDGATLVGDVASKGPAALAKPASKLAETLIMTAYKNWVDKTVSDKFAVTISNIQFKIRNLSARIQNLKSTEQAAKVAAASSNANAAARDVKTADDTIRSKSNLLDQKRINLGIYIQQKYKDVASFRIVTEATAAMRPVLAKYLIDLLGAKEQLKELAPWQQYYAQLMTASNELAGLSWLSDPTQSPPQVQRQQSPDQQAAKLHELARIRRLSDEMARVGTYIEIEQVHYDREIEKVQSGGYLDFIQSLDQAVLGMLPTKVPV